MGGGESAGVTLPKDDLREMGVIDEDGSVGELFARVERVEGSEFRIELVD